MTSATKASTAASVGPTGSARTKVTMLAIGPTSVFATAETHAPSATVNCYLEQLAAARHPPAKLFLKTLIFFPDLLIATKLMRSEHELSRTKQVSEATILT